MNEPFLLSNLIDLQNLDNEIFKLIAEKSQGDSVNILKNCLLYTSPSPRDISGPRMPSSA